MAQTPFEISGTPQSSRARRAAQYARSIDDVVRILSEGNNGLYTNDWPIADLKTGETAVFLLGTKRSKLWRSSDTRRRSARRGSCGPTTTPATTACGRSTRCSPTARRSTWSSRPGTATWRSSTSTSASRARSTPTPLVRLWASSPVNRPHACDGKVTDTEMGRQMVFLAHYGKTTLREKVPGAGNRRMPDLPGAIPHLTLGWATMSPKVLTGMLKAARLRGRGPTSGTDPGADRGRRPLPRRATPGSGGEASFRPAKGTAGWPRASAGYWSLLHNLPDKPDKAFNRLSDALAELGNRYLYVTAREADLAPVDASALLRAVRPVPDPARQGHLRPPPAPPGARDGEVPQGHARRPRALRQPAGLDRRVSGGALGRAPGRTWLASCGPGSSAEGLPDPRPEVSVEAAGAEWVVRLEVTQTGTPYRLWGSVGDRVRRPAGAQADRAVRCGDQRRVACRREADSHPLQRRPRLPGGPRPLRRLVELRRRLRPHPHRLRHSAPGRGQPHRGAALPDHPGGRLLGDPPHPS